jgi:hypothetical protein
MSNPPMAASPRSLVTIIVVSHGSSYVTPPATQIEKLELSDVNRM